MREPPETSPFLPGQPPSKRMSRAEFLEILKLAGLTTLIASAVGAGAGLFFGPESPGGQNYSEPDYLNALARGDVSLRAVEKGFYPQVERVIGVNNNLAVLGDYIVSHRGVGWVYEHLFTTKVPGANPTRNKHLPTYWRTVMDEVAESTHLKSLFGDMQTLSAIVTSHGEYFGKYGNQKTREKAIDKLVEAHQTKIDGEIKDPASFRDAVLKYTESLSLAKARQTLARLVSNPKITGELQQIWSGTVNTWVGELDQAWGSYALWQAYPPGVDKQNIAAIAHDSNPFRAG